MKKFSLLFLIIFSIIIFTQFNCKSPTAPSGSGISISVADVSCTEVWLNLSANNVTLPANIIIKKNGNNFLNLNLTTKDTTLYDSTLSPNQTYTYQAQYNKGFALERSGVVTAKTLDTTSSNFNWQVFTFGGGGGGSSLLYDVAIVNDTSIWVVGEIYTKDSVGKYNATHWDGEKWNFISIYYYDSNGSAYWNSINSIIAFNNNDIWFGNYTHWNGNNFKSIPLTISFPSTIDKFWGTSSNNLYIIGHTGLIAFFSNQTWQRIESGTTLDIQDIWGTVNPITNNEEIYCVASNKYGIGGKTIDKKVIKISNGHAIEVSNTGLPWSISSIWFPQNARSIYIAGDGIFRNYQTPKDSTWENITGNITQYYSHRIRGNGLNDIFICGSYGDVAHFNGLRWTDYLGNGLQTINGNLYGLAVKGNTVCAVGSDGYNAIIVLGKR